MGNTDTLLGEVLASILKIYHKYKILLFSPLLEKNVPKYKIDENEILT